METTNAKRFENWENVDCNECAKYWDSSCDGVKPNAPRRCNCFIATRKVVIPAKIARLEKEVARLRAALRMICVSTIMLAIAQIIQVIWGG